MKHVTTSAKDYVSVEDSTTDIEKDLHSNDTPTTTATPNSTTKVDKKNFQEQCFGLFFQMAKNSSIMVNFFEKTDASLEMIE